MNVGDRVTVVWGDGFVAEVLTLPRSGKLTVRPENAGPDAWLIVDVTMVDTGGVLVRSGHTVAAAPEVAHAELREIGAALRDTQWRVLDTLVHAGRSGLIDHEHKARNDMGQTSAGVRRGELLKLGLVEYAGHMRQVDGGKGSRAKVWRVTARGRLVWQLEHERRLA